MTMTMSNQQEITIQLLCRKLPGTQFEGRTAVRLGIQNGKDVIEDVPGDAQSVTFTVPLRVTGNPKNGQPNFLGPFAHGTPDQRFLYLCWGERQGESWETFRRAKVHLSHLSWQVIDKALETGQPIKAFMDMTDDKGGPLCASIKDDKIEWKI
jgi:hypothetical protein